MNAMEQAMAEAIIIREAGIEPSAEDRRRMAMGVPARSLVSPYGDEVNRRFALAVAAAAAPKVVAPKVVAAAAAPVVALVAAPVAAPVDDAATVLAAARSRVSSLKDRLQDAMKMEDAMRQRMASVVAYKARISAALDEAMTEAEDIKAIAVGVTKTQQDVVKATAAVAQVEALDAQVKAIVVTAPEEVAKLAAMADAVTKALLGKKCELTDALGKRDALNQSAVRIWVRRLERTKVSKSAVVNRTFYIKMSNWLEACPA